MPHVVTTVSPLGWSPPHRTVLACAATGVHLSSHPRAETLQEWCDYALAYHHDRSLTLTLHYHSSLALALALNSYPHSQLSLLPSLLLSPSPSTLPFLFLFPLSPLVSFLFRRFTILGECLRQLGRADPIRVSRRRHTVFSKPKSTEHSSSNLPRPPPQKEPEMSTHISVYLQYSFQWYVLSGFRAPGCDQS
jgi:hypothetical protein